MGVVEIKSKAEFLSYLAQSKSKPLAVKFTATWCPPCKMIAPYFAKLSEQYPEVLFVEVDVDQQKEISSSCGIRSMPTFQFYINGKKASEFSGADPRKLESTIKQLKTNVTGGGSSTSQKNEFEGCVGHGDLNEYIIKSQAECLNSTEETNVESIFKNDNTHITSDVDEQLVFHFKFSQTVKLYAICIKVPKGLENSGPKTVKLYANLPNVGFEDAESVEPTDTLIFSENDYNGNGALEKVKFVRFQKIDSLSVFVEDNVGGSEVTCVGQITLIGTPNDKSDLSALLASKNSQH